MPVDVNESTAELEFGAAGAVSDGARNVTLVATIRDAQGAPLANRQVRVKATTAQAEMLVDHDHVAVALNPSDPIDNYVTYTDAAGVARFPLGSVSTGNVTVPYLVEAGDDTPLEIQYTESASFLAGFRTKPDGSGYIVGTIATIPFTRTFAAGSPQTITDAWIVANNTFGGVTSYTIRNTIFADTTTLAFTPDPNNPVRFSNCVFASAGNYSLVTQGRTYIAANCGFRGGLLAAVYGEGGTHVRSVWDLCYRDAWGVEQGATFTPTAFYQCRFKNLAQTTDGYAFRGTPMRNVIADHCWFDLASSPNVLGIARNVTEVGGSRGPSIIACWITGGTATQIASLDGASDTPQFLRVKACRFDTSAAEYVESDCAFVAGFVQGNVDEATGVLLDDAAANETPGPVEMFPLVALTSMPQVNWIGSSTGGGGGGPGIPPGEGGADLGVQILYRVTQRRGEPVGGGGPGGPVVTPPNPGDSTGIDPVGGTGPPPNNPLRVGWDQSTSQMVEGGKLVITARLVAPPGPGGVGTTGWSVAYIASYGTNTSDKEFTLPVTVDFLPGATVAQFVIQSLPDTDVESSETLTLTLQPLVGDNGNGQQVTLIEVDSAAAAHVVTVLDDDVTVPTAVPIFFGLTATTIVEGPGSVPVHIPIKIGGQPGGAVNFRVTVTGTAILAPALGFDFAVDHTPVSGTVNQYAFTFTPTTSGATPSDIQFNLRIIDDISPSVYEPDETIVLTLTSDTPALGEVTGGACTITIDDPQAPPSTPPIVGWTTTAVALFEGTNYGATLGSDAPNNAFSGFAQVRVEVISQTASFTLGDFNVTFTGGYESQTGTIVGLMNFSAGERYDTCTILPAVDNTPESTEGETFILRILPPLTGTAYTVDAPNRDLVVTLYDPLSGGTSLVAERIPGLTHSLVFCTVPVIPTLTPTANGWNMEAGVGGERTNCQWYPVSYKDSETNDGEPDAVFLCAYLPGAVPSVPGNASAIQVHGGQIANPTPPITIANQITELLANNLRLTLVHNVNTATADYNLPLYETSGANARESLIDNGVANRQGGGPSLFARYRVANDLRNSSYTAGTLATNACTVARVYMDFRADVNAVRLAVHWMNNRWSGITSSDGHKIANPGVDGDLFFESLHLNGVPDGWAAVMADPRSTVTAFRNDLGAGNNRVEIIKALGGTARHYCPPLRGHIAYIVLYKTAEVTSTQATAILNGDDIGYAFGPLGIDRNDVLGEHGFMAHNYGEGTPPFTDFSPSGGAGVPRWAGAARFMERQTVDPTNGIVARVTAGRSDKFYGSVQRGWWLPFGDAEGGAPAGDRIDITGAVYPGKWKRRKNQLEMVHLWHRVGMIQWKDTGADVTDEDFTWNGGCCTAMWRGIGAQRMAHQHFFVPDFYEGGTSGVAAAVKLGPGMRRAVGVVTFMNPIVAGDAVTITSHVPVAWTYEFVTTATADSGTTTYVTISTTSAGAYNHEDTLANFYRKVVAKAAASNYPIHLRRSNSLSGTFNLRYKYHGTVGNGATVTTSTPSRVTVTTFAGGLSTNAVATVKPWNYLVYGSNTCTQDMFNDWHTREIADSTIIYVANTTTIESTDLPFHSWDWPHMARMNEVTRDGWWLYLDPIAHDITIGLMHLATQCFSRFPPAPTASNPFISGDAATSAMLGSSCAYSSLSMIHEGHTNEYLRTFITQNHDSRHPAATFAARVSATARNYGFWAIRNPQNAAIVPTSSFTFTLPSDWPIDRGWGWAMATVARGYAIDSAHRASTLTQVVRLRLHPGLLTLPVPALPSWFEMVRLVIRDTMHACGAPSSSDIVADGRYSTTGQYGPVNFAERRGAMPGGTVNDLEPQYASLENEWYSIAIVWHAHFVALGAYAVGKRVYQWVGRVRSDVPEVTNALTTVAWWQELRGLWSYINLVMRAAAAVQQGSHFFVPSFPCVGSGTPSTTGGLGSNGDGIYGRYNPQTGSANPDTIANAPSLFWWTYAATQPIPPAGGSHSEDHYKRDYFLWTWMLWRLRGAPLATEAINRHGGLINAGAGTIEASAVPICTRLKTDWQALRLNSPLNDADKIAWAIQWHRNEFVPPSTPNFP